MPVSIVLTFQVPTFRAGLFSRFTAGLFSFFYFVAWCASCGLLFGWFLIHMHPMRIVGRGGTAPFCLEAAQLEAGDSCPMRSQDPSHLREQPLAPCFTPIARRLITGNCCSRVVSTPEGEAGVSSLVCNVVLSVCDASLDVCLGNGIWRTVCCPCSTTPSPRH